MQIPTFIEEIKEKIVQRRQLCQQKEALMLHLLKSKDAYIQAMENQNNQKVLEIINTIHQLIVNIKNIETQITDIDIFIITKLEMNLIHEQILVTYNEKYNEAGDYIPKTQFVIGENSNTQYTVITPNDLWFLKMIKEALGNPANIEIITKQDKGGEQK